MRKTTRKTTRTTTRTPTLDQVIDDLSRYTDHQRSLAWSPEPPYQSTGAHDCRPGGDCGLDFNYETPRARWIQARYRWLREQRQLIARLLPTK